MRLFTKFTSAVAGCILWAQASHAAWVGVFLLQGPLADHVHVSVADHGRFNNAYELNIWNDRALISTTMAAEMNAASKWVLFWHPATKAEIGDKWSRMFGTLLEERALLSKNCAYATRALLEDGLGVTIERQQVLTHFFLFVWTYHAKGFVELPETIYKQVRNTLQSHDTLHYTKADAPDAVAFLKTLAPPQ